MFFTIPFLLPEPIEVQSEYCTLTKQVNQFFYNHYPHPLRLYRASTETTVIQTMQKPMMK